MKIFIKWTLLIGIFCIIAVLANLSFKKIQAGKTMKEKFSTLPALSLIALDSSVIETSTFVEKSLTLIHFNSECDHCQYEVKDIKSNVEAFSDYNVVFMSSEPLAKIDSFAEASGLNGYTNILFTKISSNDAFTSFGALAIPHVFIYGPDKKLRKEFKGETKAEAILKYLN